MWKSYAYEKPPLSRLTWMITAFKYFLNTCDEIQHLSSNETPFNLQRNPHSKLCKLVELSVRGNIAKVLNELSVDGYAEENGLKQEYVDEMKKNYLALQEREIPYAFTNVADDVVFSQRFKWSITKDQLDMYEVEKKLFNYSGARKSGGGMLIGSCSSKFASGA